MFVQNFKIHHKEQNSNIVHDKLFKYSQTHFFQLPQIMINYRLSITVGQTTDKIHAKHSLQNDEKQTNNMIQNRNHRTTLTTAARIGQWEQIFRFSSAAKGCSRKVQKIKQKQHCDETVCAKVRPRTSLLFTI